MSRRASSTTVSASSASAASSSRASEPRSDTPRWRRFLRSRIASETTTSMSSAVSTLPMTSPTSSPPPPPPVSTLAASGVTSPSPEEEHFYAEARRRFARYLDNPCVHGLKYIARRDYPVAVRALWALVFFSSIVGLVTLSYQKTFSSSSATRISVVETRVPLEKYPFPSVTVCPLNSMLKNPSLAIMRMMNEHLKSDPANFTLDDMYIRTMQALQDFRYPHFSSDWASIDTEALRHLGTINPRDIMYKMLPPCEYLFAHCWWYDKEVDCCAVFDLQETHYGFCYAFNSCTSVHFKDKPDCKPANGSREARASLTFITNSPIESELVDPSWSARALQVLVGDPYELPQPVSGYFLPEPARSVYRILVSLSVQDADPAIRAIPWQMRNCKFRHEEHTLFTATYNQQTCIEACRLQLVRKLCNCTPYYFTTSTRKYDEEETCNATGMQCVFENRGALRTVKSEPSLSQHVLDGLRLFANSTGFDCECPPDCQILMYNSENADLGSYTGGVYDDNTSAVVVVVRLRNMEAKNVVYYKSARVTFSQFLADLGNIAALFLGVSILSVFEFIYVSISCLNTLYDGLGRLKKISHNVN